MARCHCWVPLLGGGDCTRWRSGCGAIAGCHVVKVRLLGAVAGCNRRGVVMTHFDRLDVVSLLGGMVRCHCWMPWWVPLLGAIAGCAVPW